MELPLTTSARNRNFSLCRLAAGATTFIGTSLLSVTLALGAPVAAESRPKAAVNSTSGAATSGVGNSPAAPSGGLAEHAPSCTGTLKECSKRAFDHGTAAFEKGHWLAAVEHFKVAESLTPHPVIAYNLAQAEAKAGLLLEAVARLEAVVASKGDVKLLERAQRSLNEVRRNVPTVIVDWPGQAQLSIELDGALVSGAGNVLRTNPGQHTIKVTPPGRLPVEQVVDLAPGDRLQLRVSGASRTIDVVLSPDAVPAETGAEAPRGETGLSPVWVYSAAGLSVLLLGAATYSGIDTLAAKSDYDRDRATLTDDERARRLAQGHDLETRTNVLWAVGAGAALGTTVLAVFFTDWKRHKTPVKSGVSFRVGPGDVALYGRF